MDNCLGVELYRGQLSGGSCPGRNYLGVIVRGAKVWEVIVLGGISLGEIVQGAVVQGELVWGNCLGGKSSGPRREDLMGANCPRDSCPGGNVHIPFLAYYMQFS